MLNFEICTQSGGHQESRKVPEDHQSSEDHHATPSMTWCEQAMKWGGKERGPTWVITFMDSGARLGTLRGPGTTGNWRVNH